MGGGEKCFKEESFTDLNIIYEAWSPPIMGGGEKRSLGSWWQWWASPPPTKLSPPAPVSPPPSLKCPLLRMSLPLDGDDGNYGEKSQFLLMFLDNLGTGTKYQPDNEIRKPFQCTFQNSLWRNTKHYFYHCIEDNDDGDGGGDDGEGSNCDGDGGDHHPPNCRHLLRQPPLHPTNVTASKTCHITIGQRIDNIQR